MKEPYRVNPWLPPAGGILSARHIETAGPPPQKSATNIPCKITICTELAVFGKLEADLANQPLRQRRREREARAARKESAV